MTAIGIDLGGTKIEAQIFDDAWSVTARKRFETPDEYGSLIAAIADLVAWADDIAGTLAPIGIGSAGLINPETGLALTANLPASGRPFPADITKAVGRPVTYLNDCRALALSEAVFGEGKGKQTVVAVVFGTGVGGGVATGGHVLSGPTQTGGEFGHMSAPAHLVAQYDLPVIACGCGRTGCIESYISGPGLKRLARHMTGNTLTPRDIAARRQGDMADVWQAWCELTADLLQTLTLTIDPDVIVLGGGLTRVSGLIPDLEIAAKRAQIGDFGVPRLALAQGGDASGARGAAYAAWCAGNTSHQRSIQ